MGAASMIVSCICDSLMLPWPVCRPAVALGRFLTLDLVVRCSSTSGAEIELWCPGTLCWSPVPSTLWRLESLSVSRLWIRFSSSHFWSLLHWRHLIVARPASAGGCCLSGLWASGCDGFTHGYGCRLSSSPSGVADGDISVPLMPCASTRTFSGQSWPLLASLAVGFQWTCAGLVLPRPLGACRSTLCLVTGWFLLAVVVSS